jgi:hypothetical protein
MTLYILKAIPSGRIKIGISDEFDKRLSAIRRQNSEAIDVAKTFSDHDADYIRQFERDLHEELASVRFQFEWFEDGPEVQLVLDRLERDSSPIQEMSTQ